MRYRLHKTVTTAFSTACKPHAAVFNVPNATGSFDVAGKTHIIPRFREFEAHKVL